MASKDIIHRITLFKIPQVEDQEKLLNIYKGMPSSATKDGIPYIKSVRAGQCGNDERAQGYTIAAQSVFESLDDMHYYEKQCQAHAALRQFARSVHEGFMVLYFKDVLSM